VSRTKKSGNSFHHKKRLGQNFLRDEGVIQEIAEASEPDPDTLIIEIGPGEGVLTEALAESAGYVAAVELDDDLIPILRTRFALNDNVEIIHGDILAVNLPALIREMKDLHGLSKVRIVGNLPYYITTPIIMKLLEENLDILSITVMMQKEVADRLIAEPGTKKGSAITYAVQYRCTVEKICDVDRTCFRPAPKVDSTVLRLNLREDKPVHPDDEKLFFRCIKAGFMMRRKTLLNSLAALNSMDQNLRISREDILRALTEIGIDPRRRAESLTMEEFAALSDAIGRNIG